MKNKLKQAYKPTPERFRYTVRSSIEEAVSQPAPNKKSLSNGWRAVIAIALIATLLPSAVFGASKLYELMAKPVDNYGLELDVQRETAAEYPKYVKMHIDIPEGFAEVPGNEGTKFYNLSTDEPYTDGFTVLPMRYENADQKAYIANVGSYDECVVSGHQAYNVTIENAKGTWEQLYVYFEDVNVMVMIYHKDVTDEQINDFVSGISFTEGTVGDHTYLYEPYDERQNSEAVYKYEQTFIEQPLDTKLTFKHYSQINDDESLRYNAQITDIRITDNITGLDESCFNQAFSPNIIAQVNGDLVPKEFTVFKEGDGFTSTYEELSVEQKEQKLILADITYENLSDEDIDLYVPYHLSVMNDDEENGFTSADVIDENERIYSTGSCDTEITYLSPHGDGKSFYITKLKANETLTVTIGIRCCADMLDKAYLSIDDVSEIIDPDSEGNRDYTAYLFKVTENDR